MRVDATQIKTTERALTQDKTRNAAQNPFSPNPNANGVGAKGETASSTISIAPQAERTPRLAVRLPDGNYTHLLTSKERAALEVLFEKYAERQAAGNYADSGERTAQTHLGRNVDFRI